jgi:hypothetical protein
MMTEGKAMDEKTKLVYETLGRLQGVVEMLEKPELYRLSPEAGLMRIREIVGEYKLNSSVIVTPNL